MTELTREQVRTSRRISMVLRHRPESAGLVLDANGWVPVGTPRENVASILREGLRSRSRHHVHLSMDVPTAVRVGRRRSSDVAVLTVAAATMAAEGHVFHRSENGVWLTAAVPPGYLSPEPTNP